MRIPMQVAVWGLATVAAGAVLVGAQSKLADFGLSADRLKPQIVESLTNGNFPGYPNSRAYRAASTAARVAFVKDVLSWFKAYTQTAAFQADYQKRRAEAKPEEKAAKGSADSQYTAYIEQQKKQLEQMKKSVAAMSPDMQKQMQPVLQQLQESIDKTSKDPQMAAMMKQGFTQEAASDVEQHKKDLAEYDQRWPADPKVLIARRMREFLDETNGIDWDAKLVPAGDGKMRFADDSLESKPERWKLYYRAGKEPVEAARAFASDWLRQLGGK